MKNKKLLMVFMLFVVMLGSCFLASCSDTIYNSVIESVSDISKTYDGEAVSLPTFLKKGDGEVKLEWFSADLKLDNTPINAGSYKVIISIAQTKRYWATTIEKAFVIRKASNVITNISSLDQIYGAQAPQLSYSSPYNEGALIEYYAGDQKLNERPTLPGAYKVKISIAESNNYLFTSAEKAYVISKAQPVFDVPTEINAYFGDSLTAVELPNGWAWKNPNAKVGDVGHNYHLATYTPDSINYEIVDDYPLCVNVLEREINEDSENLVVNALDVIEDYDGTSKTIDVVLSAGGENATVSYSIKQDGVYTLQKPTFVNAGTYTIYYKVEKPSYVTYYDSAILTINKKTVPRPTADLAVFRYDGNPKTYNPQGFDNSIMTIAGNVQTNPNTFGYPVSVLLKDAGNYKWPGESETNPAFSFVITKGQDEITGISDLSHMFGSDYPTLSYSTKSGASTSVFYMVGSSLQSAQPINAGTYKVVVRTNDSDNYIGVSAERSFEITKARDEIRQIGDLSQTYGAHAPTISFEVASGSTANVTYYQGATLLGARPVNAGTYKVRIEVAESQNHTGTAVEKTYVISKKNDSITNISNLNQTFDGDAPELSYEVASGQTPTISYFRENTVLDARPTAVGNYRVVLSTNESQNYFGTTSQKTYEISKAQSIISSISSLAQTYGETPPELVYDKVGDGEISVSYYQNTTLLGARPQDAGEGYRVVIMLSEGDNYFGSSAQAEYTISPKAFEESAITCSDVVTSFDGTEKSVNVVLSGEAEGAVVEYYSETLAGFRLGKPSFINACLNQEISFRVSKKNYLPYTSSNYVTINKIASAISNISDLSQNYNAVSKPQLTYDKVGDGVISITYKNGEETLTARPTTAGNYTVVVSIAEGVNYLASFAERAYVINKIEPTYVLPEGLTAKFGSTLASISLPANWSWQTPEALVGNAGTNEHFLTYTPSDENHLVKSGISVFVSVSPRVFSVASVISYNVNADYDGTAKSISVALYGEAEGATITYKDDVEANYSATNPTYTIGKHTVYYKVEKANYVDYCGSTTIYIIRKLEKPTTNESAFVYNGTPQEYLPINFDSETMTISNNVCTEPGNYTAMVCIKNNIDASWADGTNTILNFEFEIMKKKVLEPTVSSVVYNYLNYEAVLNPVSSSDWSVYDNSNIASERGTYTIKLGLSNSVNYEWVDAEGNPEDGLIRWSCEDGSLSSFDEDEFIIRDLSFYYNDRIMLEVGCTLESTSGITVSYSLDNYTYSILDGSETREGVEYFTMGDNVVLGNSYLVGTQKIFYKVQHEDYHPMVIIADLIINYEPYTQVEHPVSSQSIVCVGIAYSSLSLSGGVYISNIDNSTIGGSYSFKQPNKLFVEGLNTCTVIFTPFDYICYGPMEFEMEIFAYELPYKSLTINNSIYTFFDFYSDVTLKAFPGEKTTITFPAVPGYIVRHKDDAISSISLDVEDNVEIKIYSESTFVLVQKISFKVISGDCIEYVSFEYSDGTVYYHYNNIYQITAINTISKINVEVKDGYAYKMYFNGKLYDRANPRSAPLSPGQNNILIVVGEDEEMLNRLYYVKYSLYYNCVSNNLFAINNSDVFNNNFYRASSIDNHFTFNLNSSLVDPNVEYMLYVGDTSVSFNTQHEITASGTYSFERRASENGEIVLALNFDIYYFNDVSATPNSLPVSIIPSEKYYDYYVCITRNKWEYRLNINFDNTTIGFGEDVPRLEEFTIKKSGSDGLLKNIDPDDNHILELDGDYLRLRIFNVEEGKWYATAIRIIVPELSSPVIVDQNVLVKSQIYNHMLGEDYFEFVYNDETAIYEASLTLPRGDFVNIQPVNPGASIVGLDGIVFEREEYDNIYEYMLTNDSETFVQIIRFKVTASDGVTFANYELKINCAPKLTMSFESTKIGGISSLRELFFDYTDPSGTYPNFFYEDIIVATDESGLFTATASFLLNDFDILNDEGGLWIEGNGDKFVRPTIFTDFGDEELYHRTGMTLGALIQPDADNEKLYSNILYEIRNDGTNDYFEFLLVIGDDYKTYVLCTVLLTND